MATFDAHANFVYTTVATPPSPATTGTSLVVAAGTGVLFPTAPFNVVTFPANTNPTILNAEILRVTAVATDTLTIARGQEGSTAQQIAAGYQVGLNPTKKWFTDIESAINAISISASGNGAITTVTNTYSVQTTDDNVFANATTAGFIVTLPTAIGVGGKSYTIKKVDSTVNTVVVNTTSSQNIDQSTSYNMSIPDQSITVTSDNANWNIVSGENTSAMATLTESATVYVTTTGNDSNTGLTWATAKATIANAIATLPANGGIVQLGYGTFAVSSTGRTDTGVSYSTGTWTDASIGTGDVGSYVLGANINSAEVPKITSVVASTSFTTDIAPAGSVSSQSILIVKPAFVLPAGVQIKGVGTAFAQSNNSNTTATSKVLDSGTGVTCLIRGGSSSGTQAIRYGFQDLSLQGNSNSPLYGLYIGNFAWMFTARNCDFGHYSVAAVAADGNINSDSFYDCTFASNGNFGSTTYTGAIILHPFYLVASSSFNLYNCFFSANYGWDVVDAQSVGACSIGLFDCQFNSTNATSATGSGTSLAIADHGGGADAKAVVVGGWAEGSALYDVDAYGSPTIINFSFSGGANTTHLRATGGNTQLIGCRFENSSHDSVSFGSGGQISWMGCTVNDSAFYSGCGFSNSVIPYAGSTLGNSVGYQLGTANRLFMGTGAPPTGTGAVGDFWFRPDGSSGTYLYVKTGSTTWTGLV